MNALGVDRSPDGQRIALVEIGEHHCATCFADGVQMITGCTFGKGNIHRTQKGKWGLTLIDKATGRAVRVSPKAEAMLANKQTSFFKDYREKGTPASQVPDEVVDPLVEKVMTAPDDALLNIGEVHRHEWQEPKHSFSSFVCDECGEMVVEGYGRVAGEMRVCIPCHEKLTELPEPQRIGCVEC